MMEDLLNLAEQQTPQLPEYTVSEISFEIKKFVETTFNRVKIRGEIFGAKRADSGHWYLSLKDPNAVLSAVIWKGTASRLSFRPEDGMEVVATGKITTFAGKSSYQLVIEQMEIAGAGALLKLLEERKQKFAAEGLFDPAHKNPFPFCRTSSALSPRPAAPSFVTLFTAFATAFPAALLSGRPPYRAKEPPKKSPQPSKASMPCLAAAPFPGRTS